ncbi:MAG TPA: hypothetical protein VKX16_04155 [Chloroflexota bacterium]|nr:hypothetical protein [Chloroflexota bacterium]
MPRFTTAPVEEVVPRRKQRQPSQRAQMQRQYREALRDAVDNRQALVVELDPDDKPLTIRSRLKRAAVALGLDDVQIRRRRDRIVAYLPGNEEAEA